MTLPARCHVAILKGLCSVGHVEVTTDIPQVHKHFRKPTAIHGSYWLGNTLEEQGDGICSPAANLAHGAEGVHTLTKMCRSMMPHDASLSNNLLSRKWEHIILFIIYCDTILYSPLFPRRGFALGKTSDP